MSEKLTKKEIEVQIKECFKQVNIHLKILKLLHDLSLKKRDLERSEFEAKVKEFVGESDFHYIKDFMKYKKAS